jgi:SAM-dependent methyltransferase
MYVGLDEEVERLLCCPWCKTEVVRHADCFVCDSCGLTFPGRTVQVGEATQELVFDFRIHRPAYCTPDGQMVWTDVQSGYEQRHKRAAEQGSIQRFLDNIESLREVYASEYHILGKVLDVGGHQGLLRQHLGDDVSLYVSVDPYIDVFADIEQQPMLLSAYSSLSKPCNFIAASAEYLPFRSGAFDWVHMRNAVDHFADPYLAFLEAYRCSKADGKLLVGLEIMEKVTGSTRASLPVRLSKKLKNSGPLGLLRALSKRFGSLRTAGGPPQHADGHMFRLKYGELMDLFASTGWHVVKEYWRKPPCEHIVYACGQKSKPS